MLCNLSPHSLCASYFLSHVKTVYRIDKFLSSETSNENLDHISLFIKKLNLSPKSVALLEKQLKKNKWQSSIMFYSNNFQKDINLLIKRNFHTRRTSKHVTDESNVFMNKTIDHKNSEELKYLMGQFKTKPDFQIKLFEAYQLGCEKYINSLSSSKKAGPSVFKIFSGVLGLFLIYSILFDLKKSSTNNACISKCLQRPSNESGATLVSKVDEKFDDVQGCDEVKKDLQDVVRFLKNPDAFTELGAKLPKGVLLCGDPGVGKTLLARAVAGEAGVPFLYASGSQFEEMFVGVGASRIRALFNEAKEHSPCVVFIDELDAVCSQRSSSVIHPYANQSINQLLSEMDGFVQNEGIIVIGATNRADQLDKAVLRPGRFDLKIKVYPPDFRGRMALFNLYLSKILTNGNIDVQSLAKSTIGSTGAEIKNIVNQAAIICALKEDPAVTMSHIWESQTKLSLGSARNRPTDEKDNILTAYHEAGHTIVKYFTPNSPDRVKVVTIIPRGPSGGHTSSIPKEESNFQLKAHYMAYIDGIMGGRAAEELLNGPENISNGISSDMKNATEVAKQMVQTFSMSEEVGLQVYTNDKVGNLSASPKMAEVIDVEVNRILKESYLRAKSVIQEHQKEWHLLAKALLKYETLETDDIELVINGKPPKIASITEEPDKNQNPPIGIDSSRLLGFFSSKD